MTFDEFKIHDQLLEAISYMNYKKASPIQEKAIPVALTGKDILACAQTGTGKTASFVIPILNDLVINKSDKTTSLIIVPTRELAIQIDQEIQGFSYFTDATSKSVFGGDKGLDWDNQKQAIGEGTNIIIATPGRLLQHITLGNVNFKHIRHLILDEADRMLDMGFYEDIKQIINVLPTKRQTMLFSATMPPRIEKLAHRILHKPEIISLAISKPAENVTQSVYLAHPDQKIGTIHHILNSNPDYDSIIIFSSTKKHVQKIVNSISKKVDPELIGGISSDLEQKEREEVLMNFKAKKTKILVATDVVSRGIDIKGINLVINYDVPADAADYVHRVGRTARADAKGEAITLVCQSDFGKLSRIERLIEKQIDRRAIPDELGAPPVWQKQNKKKPHSKGNNKKHSKNNHKKKPSHHHKKKNEKKES